MENLEINIEDIPGNTIKHLHMLTRGDNFIMVGTKRDKAYFITYLYFIYRVCSYIL